MKTYIHSGYIIHTISALCAANNNLIIWLSDDSATTYEFELWKKNEEGRLE